MTKRKIPEPDRLTKLGYGNMRRSWEEIQENRKQENGDFNVIVEPNLREQLKNDDGDNLSNSIALS